MSRPEADDLDDDLLPPDPGEGEVAAVLTAGTLTLGISGDDRLDRALVEALAASSLAVETAVTVRDKVVEAYQEILRMPV
jgi:flagellar hook-basal body complex protein FliE